MNTGKEIEKKINEADAEIMDIVYQWAEINFGVKGWAQDSTEVREVLKRFALHIAEVTKDEKSLLLEEVEVWADKQLEDSQISNGYYNAMYDLKSLLTNKKK